MNIYAIDHFYLRYQLLKKRKKQYGCLEKHFFLEYTGLSIDQFFIKGFKLSLKEKTKVLKGRLKSCTGSGKSSGFRVIFLVNLEEDYVVFMDIYPKTGKFRQDNFDDSDLADWLEQLEEEKENNELYIVEFDKDESKIKFIESPELIEKD